jgi:hypothetical protein
LVKSDPWLSKFDLSHSTMHLPLLSNVLPKYLIYRSVVRVVTKSLRNISVLGTEDKMVQGTPFWSAWSRFKQTAADRNRIDKEMEVGNVGRMICSNKNVCLQYIFFRHPSSCVPSVSQSRCKGYIYALQWMQTELVLLDFVPNL